MVLFMYTLSGHQQFIYLFEVFQDTANVKLNNNNNKIGLRN